MLNSSSLKLYEHPEIRPQIEVMKTQVIKYQVLADCVTLPGFAHVLCAVLTNSPNSCPPDRLFSIFNATYDDDQKRSHGDYIQLWVRGLGGWYLYEIALCQHEGILLTHDLEID